MSEATKPVEEPVVAPTATEAPAVTESVEAKPEETPAAEPAVAAEAPATEEVAAEPAKEVTPIEEGVLGYKGPGLLKSFIFQKKFFWFGTDAIETESLKGYLRGEKPEVGNNNAAWAAHTGKGLLLFSKKESEKGTPAGIFNLSEASEVSPDGTLDFLFSIGSHKHTFQAGNLADRDNWVSVLTSKIAEAKEIAESVKASEAYTTAHSSLSKPVAATPIAAAKKSVEVKKEEKAEDKEEAAEAKEEKKEEKKSRKDRSQSRKRTSIFGAIPGFGKKEEKVETPKEDTVAPAVEASTTEAAAVEAPVEETPVAATEEVAAAPAVEEPVVAAPVTEKPAPTKRASIFGTLQSKFSSKKVETDAPAVPAKDEEPVSETAPVIPAPETIEPLATEEASTAAAETPEVKAETPVVKSEKRKSSLPFLSKKEKATTSDEEGEKPLSPFAKLRATVRGKKAEKAVPEKAEEPAAETKTEEAKEETPAATEPVVTEPVTAAPASTAQVSATA